MPLKNLKAEQAELKVRESAFHGMYQDSPDRGACV